MKCDCGGNCKKQGTYRTKDGLKLRYKCEICHKIINSERKYKRLDEKDIKLIIKLRKNKMELRKIAKTLELNVNAVVYQLKKNNMN